jgi:hypothetical protein
LMVKSNREWERQWSANLRTGGKPTPVPETIEKNENQKKEKLSVVREENEDSGQENMD